MPRRAHGGTQGRAAPVLWVKQAEADLRPRGREGRGEGGREALRGRRPCLCREHPLGIGIQPRLPHPAAGCKAATADSCTRELNHVQVPWAFKLVACSTSTVRKAVTPTAARGPPDHRGRGSRR